MFITKRHQGTAEFPDGKFPNKYCPVDFYAEFGSVNLDLRPFASYILLQSDEDDLYFLFNDYAKNYEGDKDEIAPTSSWDNVLTGSIPACAKLHSDKPNQEKALLYGYDKTKRLRSHVAYQNKRRELYDIEF